MDSWTCHVCGQSREDENISVYKKPLIIQGKRMGEMNIRYCNDRPECIADVVNVSFVPDELAGGGDGG